MYQALYRSFRPETFEEMLGQEHIVKILRNQIATGTVSHAYLFCGTRGTGKTTTARLLAQGLNCTGEGPKPCGKCEACKSISRGTYMDVIEIDAASNNGVDNIRELRESVKYPPAAGPYKVYIIDEVHMLTNEAFNALLKTLEEPPERVVFILASTEPQRIPATILSRCLKLDFRRVSEPVLKEGFRGICGKLGVKISDAALGLITANADGSVRDGLSLLDQCLAGGDKEVSRKEILDILGTSGEETFLEITDAVSKGETAGALSILAKVLEDGKDVRQFLKDWMEHYRNLLIAKYVDRPEDILNLSGENTERLKRQASSLSLSEIREGILELSKASSEAKWSTKPRVLLELALVRLSAGEPEETSPRKGKAPSPRREHYETEYGEEEPDYGSMDTILSEQNRNRGAAFEGTPSFGDPSPDMQGETHRREARIAGAAREMEGDFFAPRGPLTSPEGGNETSPDATGGNAPGEGKKAPDLEAIWRETATRAGKSHGSLTPLAEITKPVSMENGVFTITSLVSAGLFMVETYRGELETILSQVAGRSLRLKVPDVREEVKEKDGETLASEISSGLGMPVELK